MKTIYHEPAFPVTENIGLNGLTKREHMAIEFTKAIVAGRHTPLSDINKLLIEKYVGIGIILADELIKQLNQE